METLGDKLVASSISKTYYCEKCDYKCSKKYNWSKHLATAKHLKMPEGDKQVANSGKNEQKLSFTCEFCNKEYQHRQCLWRHNKICNFTPENKKDKEKSSDKQYELMMMLIQQNSEIIKENTELRKEQADIKELILEIVKNGTPCI